MLAPLNIEGLYDMHAAALHGFLLNFLRSEADARDVLHEVFRKLARRPELLGGIRDARGFLLRLAHNQAVDLMRGRAARESGHQRLADESAGVFAPTAHPDEATFREELSEAMGELPAEQRAVVHLRLWEGLAFDAIAQALDIPVNTASSRYRYGLDKLRTLLRPIYQEIQ